MTEFSDILVPAAIATSGAATTKKQVFTELADLASSAYGLDAGMVYDGLMEREKLGSTGFGGGIAIPHAKIEGLPHVCALVVKLGQPVPFDAVDEAPVDIVFSLLSPPDIGAEHLKTLARVSRHLRNAHNVARLRGAGSREALAALLIGDETRDAA